VSTSFECTSRYPLLGVMLCVRREHLAGAFRDRLDSGELPSGFGMPRLWHPHRPITTMRTGLSRRAPGCES